MYNPTLRLLTLLEILESREKIGGTELAKKLEVSLRSVQRYVAQLQDLGIPVQSTPGVGGAYQLKPGFRLPPLMFSNDEAQAMTIGLQSLEPLGLAAFAPARALALAKLERVLPRSVAEQVKVVQDAIQLEPSPWLVPTNSEQFVVLAKAVQTRVAIAFAYTAFDGSNSVREVEPYNILHQDGRWYVIGYCRLRNATRSFRLDRMQDVQLLEGHFVRPKDFDARAFLRQSLPFAPAPWKIEVWLNLPLEEAKWRVLPHKMLLEAEDHGTLLRCGSADLEWIAAMLLSLNCEFRIRQPTELIKAFEALATRATKVVTEHQRVL